MAEIQMPILANPTMEIPHHRLLMQTTSPSNRSSSAGTGGSSQAVSNGFQVVNPREEMISFNRVVCIGGVGQDCGGLHQRCG
ncbi:MAG: hypothetical protein ACKVQR_14245 [Aquabacterium sp.]